MNTPCDQIDIWQNTGSDNLWTWFCVCVGDADPRTGFPTPSDALRDALAHHDKGDGR